jgi:pimeloyl-ACP methyl ester carboxylesterase
VKIEPFRVEVTDEVLADLRERIARTRWPDAVEGAGWSYGADPAYLRDLVTTWGTTFDCGGDVESRFARDQLLTNLTIYWATATINASTRIYYEERHASPSAARVPVPAGFAVFANEFVPEGTPPRELAERTFDVRRWSEQPRGGHFAALEEPAALAEEIRAFFRPLRG